MLDDYRRTFPYKLIGPIIDTEQLPTGDQLDQRRSLFPRCLARNNWCSRFPPPPPLLLSEKMKKSLTKNKKKKRENRKKFTLSKLEGTEKKSGGTRGDRYKHLGIDLDRKTHTVTNPPSIHPLSILHFFHQLQLTINLTRSANGPRNDTIRYDTIQDILTRFFD